MSITKERLVELVEQDECVILNVGRCEREQIQDLLGAEYDVVEDTATYNLTRSFDLSDLKDLDSQVNESISLECDGREVYYDEIPEEYELLFDRKGLKKTDSDGDGLFYSVRFSKEVQVLVVYKKYDPIRTYRDHEDEGVISGGTDEAFSI